MSQRLLTVRALKPLYNRIYRNAGDVFTIPSEQFDRRVMTKIGEAEVKGEDDRLALEEKLRDEAEAQRAAEEEAKAAATKAAEEAEANQLDAERAARMDAAAAAAGAGEEPTSNETGAPQPAVPSAAEAAAAPVSRRRARG